MRNFIVDETLPLFSIHSFIYSLTNIARKPIVNFLTKDTQHFRLTRKPIVSFFIIDTQHLLGTFNT